MPEVGAGFRRNKRAAGRSSLPDRPPGEIIPIVAFWEEPVPQKLFEARSFPLVTISGWSGAGVQAPEVRSS